MRKTRPAAKKATARRPAPRKATPKKAAPRKSAAKAAARPKAVKPIPDGYRSVTPYLAIRGAAAAIEYYKRVFGAKERMRMPGPAGSVMHAELEIGDSVVMLADEFPDMGFIGPRSRGGTTVNLLLYVRDCDRTVAAACDAGARILRPIKDEFYGDRVGTIEDPYGHTWSVATHKEDLSPAEMKRRADAAMKEHMQPPATAKKPEPVPA